MGGGILSLLLMYSDWFTDNFSFLASFNRNLLVRYCTLMIVVSQFYKNSGVLSSEFRSAGILRFIGRRTLDIYFIHFFFLPNFSGISEWLTSGNMIVFQIIYASTLTVVITAVCLLISGILRSSPILASWLFGEKRQHQEVEITADR